MERAPLSDDGDEASRTGGWAGRDQAVDDARRGERHDRASASDAARASR